jgi:hypothetical protein
MDEIKSRILPPGRGVDSCRPGEAWTCTIQCDPGTRGNVERLFNAPGVEICSVTQCHCEQLPPVNAVVGQPPSVQDAFGIPLAAVIFGIEFLVKGRP